MDRKAKISNFMDSHKDDMIALLQRLARVPSVLGEPQENMPYGQEVNDVLTLARGEAEALGLHAVCYQNIADIVTLNDKEPRLAILAHLDVVPASPEGWTNPPFEPTVKGNMIYGRGVSDNKGPCAAALYALYAIKELGFTLKNNVMLYLGGCEENGCRDLSEYLKENTLPAFVFTPDACFPVYNAERGRIVLTCEGEIETEHLLSMEAGKAINIVPDYAKAVLVGVGADEIRSRIGNVRAEVRVAESDGKVTVEVYGKSTHAAHPDKGVNAITALLSIIGDFDKEVKCLADYFPDGVFGGQGLGLSGGLDISVTQIKVENGKLFLTADGRVNLDASAASLADTIEKTIKYQLHMSVKEPYSVDKNAPVVQKLNRVFEEYTGRQGGAYTMDAMTYIHETNGGVIFGGVFWGDGSGGAHGINECYNLHSLCEAAKLFAGAILEICEVEE